MASARDLTVPVRDTSATRAALSGALRRAGRDLLRLPDPVLRPVLAVVREQLKAEPGRVMAVLRRPNVGAALRVLRQRPNARLASQLAATLAVELSSAGVALPELTFRDLPARVACLGGGFALPGGARATLDGRWWRSGRDAVSIDAPLDRPYHEIVPGLALATLDDNPLAMDEAHPDKDGNAIDLGEHTPAVWVDSLRDALERIERYLPLVREEVSLMLSQVVPVGFDAHAHLSASYAEAIGTIYLSLHPDPMTMTEAIVHELSHNKLNAVLESGPLLENAFHPLYPSPLRPDPRPLHGVLLAVHAFLPNEELYRRMAEADDPLSRRPEFETRRRAIEAKNRQGAAVLAAHAVPEPLGVGLLEEIRRLVDEGESATSPS